MNLAKSALKLGITFVIVMGVGAAIYTGWNWAERRAIKKGTAV
jgi:hypothetical protein